MLLKKTIQVLLVFSLTACGFHLRGAVTLPAIMQSTYVESQFPFDDMTRIIDQELRSSGVKVVPDKESATAVLKLISHRSNRRILSVGSSGRATEYELFEEVTFALFDAQGEEYLEPQILSITRDLVFDETQLLGKVEESEAIRIQLQQTLARRVLTRIQVSLNPK